MQLESESIQRTYKLGVVLLVLAICSLSLVTYLTDRPLDFQISPPSKDPVVVTFLSVLGWLWFFMACMIAVILSIRLFTEWVKQKGQPSAESTPLSGSNKPSHSEPGKKAE